MTGSHPCRGSKKTFSKTEASEAASRTFMPCVGRTRGKSKAGGFFLSILGKLWQLSIKLHHQQTSSAPAASYLKRWYRSSF